MTKRITDQDIVEVAHRLGIEPAALAAVLAVECGWPHRRGFDSEGRVRILFEPHIAYRLTRRRAPAKLRPLLLKGLAYRRWRTKPYPRSNAARWRQLEAAREIIGDLAYEAASYGLPQIMGFNHRKAGYESAKAMAEAFATGEREQLEALGRFLEAHKTMITALRDGHWARFAKAYNGRGYKKNRYDEKLRKAYARFSKKRWPTPRPKEPALPEAEVATSAPAPQPPQPDAPQAETKAPQAAGLFAAIAALLAALGAAVAAFWEAFKSMMGGE